MARSGPRGTCAGSPRDQPTSCLGSPPLSGGDRGERLLPEPPHLIPLVRTQHVRGHREENAFLPFYMWRQQARDRVAGVAHFLLPTVTMAGFEGRNRLLELELELAEDRVFLHQHRDRTRRAVDMPAQHREERLLFFAKVAQDLPLY